MRQEFEDRYEDLREDDVEPILRRALQKDGMGDGSMRDHLRKSAAELGISEEALIAAEREHMAEREEFEEIQEYEQERRRGYYVHLFSYVVIITFIFFIDLVVAGGGVDFAFFPAMGWGIGLAFHTFFTFFVKDDDYEKDFAKWRRKRRKYRRR